MALHGFLLRVSPSYYRDDYLSKALSFAESVLLL